MDIFSHALLGGIAFGRKTRRDFWWAFFFGMFPDLFAFGPFFVGSFFGVFHRLSFEFNSPPPAKLIPDFVYSLYSFSHSLFVFVTIFGLVWLFSKKVYYPLLAWGLHILVDIPTHDLSFFPTPFLWPFSSYVFDGVIWASSYVLIPDVIIIVVLYAWYFLRSKSG